MPANEAVKTRVAAPNAASKSVTALTFAADAFFNQPVFANDAVKKSFFVAPTVFVIPKEALVGAIIQPFIVVAAALVFILDPKAALVFAIILPSIVVAAALVFILDPKAALVFAIILPSVVVAAALVFILDPKAALVFAVIMQFVVVASALFIVRYPKAAVFFAIIPRFIVVAETTLFFVHDPLAATVSAIIRQFFFIAVTCFVQFATLVFAFVSHQIFVTITIFPVKYAAKVFTFSFFTCELLGWVEVVRPSRKALQQASFAVTPVG